MAFKPGSEWKSSGGNPRGRPRVKKSLAEILRAKITPTLIADKLKELVEKGDLAALKVAIEWSWPKPPPHNDEVLADILRRLDEAEAEREKEAGV